MKLWVIIICIGLHSFLPTQNFLDNIPWDIDRPLSWNDFVGVPPSSAPYVATTSSGISFSYSYSFKNGSQKFDYTVQSLFYPDKSWFVNDAVSEYILKHEQTHFDISELHARMLRKKLKTIEFSDNIKKKVDALYSQIEEDRRQMQQRFDKETNHSKNTIKELEWEKNVVTQLKAYEQYR